MAKFCGACGQQLSDASAFCIHCGTPTQTASVASAPTPHAPTPSAAPTQPAYSQVNVPGQPAYTPVSTPPPAQYAPVNPTAGAPSQYPPAPAAKSSGLGLKIVLVILVVLFMGGLLAVGGLLYVGHRVATKIKAAAAENGLSLTSDESATKPFRGDPCALLSKDDVSAAIGVQIVATHSTGDGCEYLAQGTSADMTARHMSAMMKTKGADDPTQDTIHKLAGGLFSAQQSESKEQTQDANGNTPVFAFSVDPNSARAQMQLNQKVLGSLGPQSPKIEGIGDEAFDSAGSMMMVRKGDKLIRIMYMMCPCSTDEVKPLARKLADAV